MNLHFRQLLLSLTLIVTMTAEANETFSSLEQQQISIPTPGLFNRSNAFSIDFDMLNASEWSFPLPIGKASLSDDYKMEIKSKKGDNVKAMFDGVVRLSRENVSYGNVIVIRHKNGLETVYGHNAQNLVKVGDKVKAGQTIAIIGSNGGKTYCQFEIMIDGRRINPEIIMDVTGHRLKRQTILCERSDARINVSIIHNELAKVNKIGLLKPDNINAKSSRLDPFNGGHEFTINLSDFNPGDWCYPLPGSHVISPYGGGRHHSGVDIKTRPNDKILAAFDGVVTMSGPYFGYGNCVVIRHANGLETLYSHNSHNLVKVGDKVKAGQPVGLTGRTGRATTEHCHFECRINGRPFDPAIIFDHLNKSLRMDLITFTKSTNGTVRVKSQKNYMAKSK